MILPIYVYGSDVLQKRAEEVEVEKEEGLRQLIDDMYITMKDADGVGIAHVNRERGARTGVSL